MNFLDKCYTNGQLQLQLHTNQYIHKVIHRVSVKAQMDVFTTTKRVQYCLVIAVSNEYTRTSKILGQDVFILCLDPNRKTGYTSIRSYIHKVIISIRL